MAARPAWLLDITRLVDRLDGRPLTGVDRVEAAYLRELIARDDRALFLWWRRAPVSVLLPGQAGALLMAVIDGQADPGGLRARLAAQRLGRAPDLWVPRLIRRWLPGGGDYLNTGHVNLRPRGLAALRRAGLRTQVMIHDTIPLDLPQHQAEDQPARFRAKLIAALTGAGRLIANSALTADDLRRWSARLGVPCPPIVTAPLGVVPPAPGHDQTPLPPGLPPKAPFFVTVGTIEPRKNHALLLDAWDLLARRMDRVPGLLILGRRGWATPSLLARLDALPSDGPVVQAAGLSDAQLARLIAASHGLLMPSLAEGVGLPMLEAADLGVPVLAAPLPTATEFLGDAVTTLPWGDAAAWADAIAAAAARPRARPAYPALPRWSDHFNLVLSDGGPAG
ncbi:glycosyltransferase [Paracoccus sp. p4-l81]|uniref:glycosyltransferase n=1 Tax=Paracoccus sp. p4-l81 TaxID=3342806 RepID=UPI0035BB2151